MGRRGDGKVEAACGRPGGAAGPDKLGAAELRRQGLPPNAKSAGIVSAVVLGTPTKVRGGVQQMKAVWRWAGAVRGQGRAAEASVRAAAARAGKTFNRIWSVEIDPRMHYVVLSC